MVGSRVSFTLYVAKDSAMSLRATRRWKALLAQYPTESYWLEIKTLDEDGSASSALERDGITRTPAMVIRGTESARIIGDLAAESIGDTMEILSLCGLRPAPAEAKR